MSAVKPPQPADGRSQSAARVDGGDHGHADIQLEDALERTNLQRALHRVERNGGAPGIDGMITAELRPYLREYWPVLARALLSGTYQPQPVRRVEIPKPGGGVRQLGIPTVLDRFLRQALLQALQPRPLGSKAVALLGKDALEAGANERLFLGFAFLGGEAARLRLDPESLRLGRVLRLGRNAEHVRGAGRLAATTTTPMSLEKWKWGHTRTRNLLRLGLSARTARTGFSREGSWRMAGSPHPFPDPRLPVLARRGSRQHR